MNHFSIDYPEYHIAGLLQNNFKKQDNFSVSIPLSRQQKDFDLLLYNSNNKTCITIQVKSSRTYINPTADIGNGYNYYAWLNNFKIEHNNSDFFFIFISFPIFDTATYRPKTGFGTKILVFDNKEMKGLLDNIKKTKKGTADRFFSFGFNIGDHRIYGERGFDKSSNTEFTHNLFENKINQIANYFS